MGNKRITKLTIKGFRSFADGVTVNLDEGLACIADPEGNGIQDLFDALCFVSGRQAPAERDRFPVIFPGNDQKDAASRAEVTVWIDNGSETFTVSRVLQISGEDTFFIDDKKSTQEQVREAVLGTGIEGYSLIDRNYVYDFIASRPGSVGNVIDRVSDARSCRLEADYKEKLLTDKRRELEEVCSRLEEYRKKKSALLDETVKVREYKKLDGMLRKNDMNILLRRIEQCEREDSTAVIRIDELNDRISEREKERSETELRITEKKIMQRNLENEEAEARGVFLNGRNEIETIYSRMSVIDGRTETVNQNLDLINQDLTVLRERLEKAKQNLRNLERRERKTDEDLTTAARDRLQIEKKLQEKTAEKLRLVQELQQLKQDLGDKQLQLSVLRIQQEEAGRRQRSFEERRETLSGSLFVKEDDLPEVFSQESDLRRLDALAEKREQAIFQKDAMEKSLDEIRKKADQLFGRYRQVYYDLAAEKSRRDLLINQENDYDSYDTGIASVLKEADLSGIRSTAGELIHVRKGYEPVISAALGSHTQDVICDDLASASAASSFLQEQEAGRLVFIPLKELNYKYRVIPEELTQADGYLGRATDYIDCDPEYSGVFQYLLGSTVVFRDLVSALGAGRYAGIRMVTLNQEVLSDSEMVESGSLKNVGTRIFQRRNQISQSESRTLELEKLFQASKTEYENAELERRKLEEKIASAAEGIEVLNREISAITLRTQAGESIMEEARKEILRLKEDLLKYDEDTQMTDFPEYIKELSVQFHNAEEELRQQELNIESCQQQLESQNDEIESLQHQISEFDSQIISLRTDLEVTRLSMQVIREEITDCESDIRSKSETAEAIQKNDVVLAREKEKLEKDVRAMEMDLADRVRILSSFREELSSLRGQIDRLINEKEKKENEYIAFRLEKRSLEVERDVLRRDAEDLKRQIFETFDIPYTEAMKQKESVFVLNEGKRESARLRNLLREYNDINTAAPDELERITEEYHRLETVRRNLEGEESSLNDSIRTLRTKEIENSRRWMDDTGREFSRVFEELSSDARAQLKTAGRSEITGLAADVYIKKEGYTARKLMYATEKEKSRAFISFVSALHTVAASPLTVIDGIDDLLEPEDRKYVLNCLRERCGESVLLITDDPLAAESAGSVYAFLKQSDGSRELREISRSEYRVYTPDREI